jgi:hypothetical protein
MRRPDRRAAIAFLDQDHRGNSRHRLGHRRDPENRVALHRRTAERELADGIGMNLALAAHQRHQAGHAAIIDIGGHHVVHAAQAGWGQTAGICGCRHSFLLKLNQAMAGRRWSAPYADIIRSDFYGCALTKAPS